MTTTAAPTPARPAATLVLLRDQAGALEVLLARRQSTLAFHGGAWVFPGGRIEPGDHAPDGDLVAAARRAAVRESIEEVGLAATGELIWFSHWTTPEDAPKRFATWFFAAQAGPGAVHVDGGEIQAHRWLRPVDALAAQRVGEIELPPATFVTLLGLSAYDSVAGALSSLAAREPLHFLPRRHLVPGGACSLYQEDAGYPDGDLERPGPRHRLWMTPAGWRYERSSG
jgi:8-oxo-dGTP pyrophosphatase MutT (NUDIX family)